VKIEIRDEVIEVHDERHERSMTLHSQLT
jgi:hypothetical protein